MQRKQPIISEMTEITVDRCQLKKKKRIFSIWLKSRSVLYWMLAEGVLEYAVVSGLVILEQSGLASSFSGLLASPCVPVWVSQIDLCCKLLNVM